MTQMQFFFDHNFPRRIARAIAAYETEFHAVHLTDDPRFVGSTPDVDWLSVLAQDRSLWCAISQDRQILRKPSERKVIANSKLRFVYFGKAWARMTLHEQAWKLLRVWPEITSRVVRSPHRVFEIVGANMKIEADPNW